MRQTNLNMILVKARRTGSSSININFFEYQKSILREYRGKARKESISKILKSI